MGNGFTWPTQKNEISTQKISYKYPIKLIFQTKKNFTPTSKNQFFTKRNKTSNTYLKKQSIFHLKKNFFIITITKFFSKQKISYTFEKKNGKVLHFRCFLNKALLFFIIANISQSLFVKHFYFTIFYIFFVYSSGNFGI